MSPLYLSLAVSVSFVPSSVHVSQSGNLLKLSLKSLAPIAATQDYLSGFDYYADYTVAEIKKEQHRLQLEKEQQEKAKEEARKQAEAEQTRLTMARALVNQRRKEQLAQPVATTKTVRRAVQRQSAPESSATLPAISGNSITDLIVSRCQQLGCDANQILRVMNCESRGNTQAYNRSSGATGLFQFMPNTFRANAAAIGLKKADIWDPYQQALVATDMFARGQAHQWVCK